MTAFARTLATRMRRALRREGTERWRAGADRL